MHVAKWGNSLAIRIPAKLARDMGLKEGDQLHILRDRDGTLRLLDREAMNAYLDSLSVDAPAGWKFNRGELYEEELERRFPTVDHAAA